MSRRLESPWHLAPAATRLERFREEPFDFVFSVPPRHGKTELVVHFIVWALKHWPWLNICYCTYNVAQAKTKSRRALQIALMAGLELTKASEGEWATKENEVVLWTGIDGPVTGKGFHIVLLDDCIKNRQEAESPAVRGRTWDFVQNDLFTRLEPNASFANVQTRWHPDDPAGLLVRGDKGEDRDPVDEVNIPAISEEDTDEERALWPSRWPLEFLKRRRSKVGPYAWSSLYQGKPRARGAKLFNDAWYYKALPAVYQAAIGADLAYTKKTSADYSVGLALLKAKEPLTNAVRYYVAAVERDQLQAPQFKQRLVRLRTRFKGAPMRWYCSGTEKGVAQFIQAPPDPVPLEAHQTTADKFQRAQPVSAAWNRGEILVPEDAPWLEDLLNELFSFTGVNDKQDDQVDALAAAFDLLQSSSAGFRTRSAEAGNAPRM